MTLRVPEPLPGGGSGPRQGQAGRVEAAAQHGALAQLPRLALARERRGRARRRRRSPAPGAPWRGRRGAPPRSPGRRSPCTRSGARRRRCPRPPGRPRRRCRSRSRAPRARAAPPATRAAQSACPAGSSLGAGAPNTQSAASPSNLFTNPPSALDHLDHDAEELVEEPHHLGRRHRERHRGRAGEVDEQGADLPLLAAQPGSVAQRRMRDLLPDLAAEEVADALALAKALGHAVEARLEQARPRWRRRSAPGRRGRRRRPARPRSRIEFSGSVIARAAIRVANRPTARATAAEEDARARPPPRYPRRTS